MLYRCIRDETSIGGVTFRKQIISERGTNDILIADFDKDGFMDMATVGFGGMNGEGGDPYVLMWLYRGSDTLASLSDSNHKSDTNDNHYSDAAVIGLIISTCVLSLLLIFVFIHFMHSRNAKRNDYDSGLSMRRDMEQSLLLGWGLIFIC